MKVTVVYLGWIVIKEKKMLNLTKNVCTIIYKGSVKGKRNAKLNKKKTNLKIPLEMLLCMYVRS
jgi:hypothetical protein